MHARGKKLTFETARFIKFILTEIFPGGRLPSTAMMVEHGEKAGFVVPEPLSLRPHYIKTLRIWGDALEANKDKAIEITSEEVFERYMKYLRGCRVLLHRRGSRRQPGHLPQARRRGLIFFAFPSACCRIVAAPFVGQVESGTQGFAHYRR